MRIRFATPADVPEMHRIRLAVRENPLSAGSAIDEASYLPFLAATLVAEAGGAIVGFAALDLARGSVWALFVSPLTEGRGIGRALHRALLDLASAHGLERLSLTTAPGTRAELFYRQAGWQPAGLTADGEMRFERAVAPSS
jgi:GNAT superfamily N-acetyltransferase